MQKTQGRVFEIRKWSNSDPDFPYRSFWCELSSLPPRTIAHTLCVETKRTLPESWSCSVIHRPGGIPDDARPTCYESEHQPYTGPLTKAHFDQLAADMACEEDETEGWE